MMVPEEDASAFLQDMFQRTSRPGVRRQVRLHEVGQLMERDQEECIAAITRLRRLGQVDIVNGRVMITEAGYDALDKAYGRGIDYDQLALTIEALDSRVSDLELMMDEMSEVQEELRSLLEDIRAGHADRAGTHRKLWDIGGKLINSGANMTTILNFLRMMWPYMGGC